MGKDEKNPFQNGKEIRGLWSLVVINLKSSTILKSIKDLLRAHITYFLESIPIYKKSLTTSDIIFKPKAIQKETFRLQ